MPDRNPMLLLRALLCALVTLALPAPARSEALYRVELLVFSTPAGATAEQWDATPELAYPRATRFLVPAGESASTVPTTAANPASPQALDSVSPAQPSEIPVPTTQASPAYVLLGASQRELGARAAALQRSGRYHILFHEAWTQPITGQAAAASVSLDPSGDGGPWPELQGTIKIYQAGSFFLDTNLWLNTAGEYLPGTWRMPPPPRAPVSQAIPLPEPAEPGVAGAAPMQPSELASAVEAPAIPSAVSGLPSAPLAAEYPYRHAVLLKQTRKMRGGQLNYIDHPLLGVLVKITPLATTEPAPEAEPASEPATPATSPEPVPVPTPAPRPTITT